MKVILLTMVPKTHHLFICAKQQLDQVKCFFVKANNRLEKVVTREILFVEAMETDIVIHNERQKRITLTPKNFLIPIFLILF